MRVKIWKKMLAVLLAVSMTGAAAPYAVSASDIADNKEISETAEQIQQEDPEKINLEYASENNALEVNENEELGESETQENLEDEIADSAAVYSMEENAEAESNAREVIENYTTLTAGQELHQTDGRRVTYMFAPEVSGYYQLSAKSISGHTICLSSDKTIYYTNDGNGGRLQHIQENYWDVYDTADIHRVMWLNQAEEYYFSCWADEYYSTDEYNFSLLIDRVEIKDIETAAPPAEESYNDLNYRGMKVKINYINGTSTTSSVSRDGLVKAFEWNQTAHNREAWISPYLSVVSIDDKEDFDFPSLNNGSHKAVLRIEESGNVNRNYDFLLEFAVKKGNISSIQVLNPQTDYTQNFQSHLSDIDLRVTYNDDTPETVFTSSENDDISQYLKYSAAGGEDTSTSSIDTYLKNGGQLGTATVYVSYRGVETSYEITIAENPYDRMEITPRRTHYYTGCGFEFGDYSYPGDYISGDFEITLYKKDGTTDSYTEWDELPYEWSRGNYGILLNGSLYQNIDSFISDGGTTGQKEVTVSYCGLQNSYEIMLTENPYDHIKLAANPDKIKYVHNKEEYLNLSGMVIYAYKDAAETESNYDILKYDDYKNYSESPGDMTEEQYHIMDRFLKTTFGGHNSTEYLELGTHAAHVFLMGHEASYNIEIVETLTKSLTVTQTPSKLIYYADYDSRLSLDGLTIQITDLQDVCRNYKYEYDSSDSEYENWWDIEDDFTYVSDIDWGTPGTYTVTVSYLGAADTFQITLLESPVKEFKIIKEPNKTSYYQYESEDIDLTGMKYQITYKDGTSYSGEAEDYDTSFYYDGQYYHLSSRWRTTFNGIAKPGENAIVFSALGYTALSGPIMVEQGPVQSLQVIENPEKMQYIGRRPKVDLFGMKLLITYLDGSTQQITFTEHTDRFEVTNEYGGTVKASVSMGRQKYLNISYRNESCEIKLPELDLSSMDSEVIQNEGHSRAVLTEEKPYCIYSFTPSETAEYHFFSAGSHDTYVELYEGGKWIDSDDDGGDGGNFLIAEKLKANISYYFVVSEYGGDAADFNCYLSSKKDSLSGLDITDVKVTKIPKQMWYDFESSGIPADNWSLKGTEYEITYSNGWKRIEEIKYYGTTEEINGILLSAEWKHTVTDENGSIYADKNRSDNALIYTYGEKTFEFPVKFDEPSPVASLTVIQHPWENWTPYEYQITDYDAVPNGILSVEIQYTDGTKETVSWETDDWLSHYHNEYLINTELKTDGGTQIGRQNLFVITYMGSSVEIPVTVLENPVRSIELLQAPEKTAYYPFEQYYAHIDLYGAKIQITYKNGKTQLVEIDQHTNKIIVPDTLGFSGTLSSYFSYSIGEDRNILAVSYMGMTQDIPYDSKAFTAASSTPMTENQEFQSTLNAEKFYEIFSFTPSTAGTYNFNWNKTGMDYYDTYIRLYNSSGTALSSSWDDSGLNYEMMEGRQYFIVLITNETVEQSYICSIVKQTDTPKADINRVSLSLNNPNAGSPLPDLTGNEYDEYYVADFKWLNDGENDAVADYGTPHRLMTVLRAKNAYRFTSATQVIVNDTKIVSKSVDSSGNLTIYYTFPHTQCKVTIPQIQGYTLDETQNAAAGVVDYGGDYKFRYTKNADNTDNSRIIVKANNTVLTPESDGYYTIKKAAENIIVTVKQENLSAGPGESKLTMYNKSSNIFDIMVGKQNAQIADNEGNEKTLPSLESYVDGSDQFFFGWYLDKDTGLNGKGERFTSQSILVNPLYDLYARWGKGIFSYILNNKQVNCRILSIDEFNKTKVQIGDAAKAAGAASAEPNARAADENGTLVIPDKIDWNSNEDLKALGITFSDCEVSAIAENTFAGDSTIKNIVLPETLESIGAGAFAGCTGLEKVSIPSSVDTVPQGAFQGCTSLSHVHLEEGVTRIDANAFDGCTNLKTLVLPDTIETVNVTAFESCKDFDIVCSSSMKEFGAVTAIQEATGARVVTVDLELDYEFDEKQFTYGDAAQTFTAKVRVNEEEAPGREIIWTYPVTTAYDFQVSTDKSSLTVTPKQATSAADRIIIKASDAESGKAKSILLSTIPVELTGVDADQKPLYSIKEIDAQKYTGSEIKPEITVIDNATKAELPKDAFDVSYTNNIQPGTASVAVSGKGNYTGKLSAQFIIEKEKAAQTITASDITKVYGNASFNISASTDGDGILSYESSDSKIVSVDSATGKAVIKKAGTVDLTIKASETDTYQEAVKTIKITVKKAALKISKKFYKKVYGSKPFKLGVSAKDTVTYTTTNKKIALVKNGKVTIKACGTAKIKVSVKSGNYTNTPQTITINVVPKKAAVKKTASKKAGQMTVTWKKQKEAAGYTIEYSTNKKFKKGVKKVNIGKNKTTSTTIKKKLSKGKKYYVRVKAYTKINKKKVYGSVSKVRQVKIKR